MTTRPQTQLVTVKDYLAGEDGGDIRHEYIGGRLYAMTGASVRHNRIARNALLALASQPRGSSCEAFMSDVKLHLSVAGEDIFYYPDSMVCCDPDDNAEYFRARPCLIIEILSESTERIERREKLLSYRRIDGLQAYLLLSQQACAATLYRRGCGWRPRTFDDPEVVLELPCAGLKLALAAVYENRS
jgi:Uma2 family endonuclease